jgi:hypothetical protein
MRNTGLSQTETPSAREGVVEVHGGYGVDVCTMGSGLTARCFFCRNRFGLPGLLVIESGVVCCRRCWARGPQLQTQDVTDEIEIEIVTEGVGPLEDFAEGRPQGHRQTSRDGLGRQA